MQHLLITGHRKSGTTLVSKLFTGYPDKRVLVFPSDFTALYGFMDPFYESSLNVSHHRGLLELFRDELSRYEEKFLVPDSSPFNLQSFLDILSVRMANFSGGRRNLVQIVASSMAESIEAFDVKKFVYKETSQAIHSHDLVSFQQDRVLCVFRDPRDVFAAISDGLGAYYSKNGESHTLALGSLLFRYRADFLSYLSLKETKGSEVGMIRFEDLIRNSKKVTRELASFSGIRFDSSMLRPQDGDEPFISNTYGKKIFEPGQIESGNVGRWTERLGSETVEVIEFFLGDIIEALGYELPKPRRFVSPGVSAFYAKFNSRVFFKSPRLAKYFKQTGL